MTRTRLVAVVPVKSLRLGKSRLAPRLTPSQRETLSLSILDRVVGAALESQACRVWVVAVDDAVKRRAAEMGAEFHLDGGSNLNDTLSGAFLAAFASGLAPMYLPADLPFLTAADVSGLAGASLHGRALTLSPAHRDGGTNAMVVPWRSTFRPSLGDASFQRHREQAAASGHAVTVFDTPGLGLDLDTLEDLAAYEERQPGLLRCLLGGASPAS